MTGVLSASNAPRETHALSAASKAQGQAGGPPQRTPNFICSTTLKDDGGSREAPIFSLTTRANISIWQWQSNRATTRLARSR